MASSDGNLTLQRRPWWKGTILGKAFAKNETQDNSRTPTATQSRLTLSAATASLRKHLPNRHNKHKRGSLHSFISDPATARSSTEGPETLFSRNSHDTEMLHLAPDVPLPTSPIDVPTHAPALTLNLGPPAFMLPTFQPSDPNDIAIGTPVDSHMHVAPESVNTAHEDCPAYEDYPTSSPATPTSLMRLSTDESRLAALLSSPMPGTNLGLEVETSPVKDQAWPARRASQDRIPELDLESFAAGPDRGGRCVAANTTSEHEPRQDSVGEQVLNLDSDLERLTAASEGVRRCVGEFRLPNCGAKRDGFTAFEAPAVPSRRILVPRSLRGTDEKDTTGAETKRLRPNSWLPIESPHLSTEDTRLEPEDDVMSTSDSSELGDDIVASILSQMEPLSRQSEPHFTAGADVSNEPDVVSPPAANIHGLRKSCITPSLLSGMVDRSDLPMPPSYDIQEARKSLFTDTPGLREELMPRLSSAWLADLPIRTKSEPSSIASADLGDSVYLGDGRYACLLSPETYPPCAIALDAERSQHTASDRERSVAGKDASKRADSPLASTSSNASKDTASWAEQLDFEDKPRPSATDRMNLHYNITAPSTPKQQPQHRNSDMDAQLCDLLSAVKMAEAVMWAGADEGSSSNEHSPKVSDGSPHGGPLTFQPDKPTRHDTHAPQDGVSVTKLSISPITNRAWAAPAEQLRSTFLTGLRERSPADGSPSTSNKVG